jgi:phenylpropionate dioxygenase-like ring-hydroxylating dioxygenase large terminal subunit
MAIGTEREGTPAPRPSAGGRRPHPWERALGRRLLAHLEAGTTDLGPAEAEVPVSVYTDPDRHRREMAALAQLPAAVCFASEVARPGSHLALRLGALPVLVARTERGALAGMVNVCRHRGSPLVPDGPGHARRLTCPFHGWSYDLDGRLRHVPEAATVGTVDCDQRSLVALTVEERHGLVWLTGRPGAEATTVRSWLGGELDDQLGDLGLDRFVLHRSVDLDVACNWKLVTDGFLETYHLRYLHRRSIAPYFESNVLAVDRWGYHQRSALPKTRLRRELAGVPPERWDVLAHTTIAHVLFPTTVLQWQAGHLEAFLIRPDPGDPARCRVRLGMLVPAERAGEVERWDRNWDRVVGTIPAEDFAQSEAVQAGFASGANRTLLLGRTEGGLAHFLAAVDQAVDRLAPP